MSEGREEQTNSRIDFAKILQKIREGAAELAALLATPIIAVREALFPSTTSTETFDQADEDKDYEEILDAEYGPQRVKKKQEPKPEIKDIHYIVAKTKVKDEKGEYHFIETPQVYGTISFDGQNQPFVYRPGNPEDKRVRVSEFFDLMLHNDKRRSSVYNLIKESSEKCIEKDAPVYEQQIREKAEAERQQRIIDGVKVTDAHVEYGGRQVKREDGTFAWVKDPYIKGSFKLEGFEKFDAIPFTCAVRSGAVNIDPKFVGSFKEDMRIPIEQALKQKAVAMYQEERRQQEIKEHPYRMKDVDIQYTVVQRKDDMGRTKSVKVPILSGHFEIGASSTQYSFHYDATKDKNVVFDDKAKQVLENDDLRRDATKSIQEQVTAYIIQQKAQRQKQEPKKTVQNQQTVRKYSRPYQKPAAKKNRSESSRNYSHTQPKRKNRPGVKRQEIDR